MTSNPGTTSAQSALVSEMLSCAKIDLYRDNAFRLTQLEIEATNRDIQRRQQEVNAALSVGLPVPPGPVPILPVDADPQIFDRILQRLQDPVRHLIDVFFWFWPQEAGKSQADGALLALTRHNVAAARSIWQERLQQSPHDAIASHNLAVLAHVSALDYEYMALTTSLGYQQAQEREMLWKDAFIYWKDMLMAPNYRQQFGLLVADLHDPRLPENSLEQIRDTLPLVLMLIQASLAIQFADIQDTLRQVRYMRDSGFDAQTQENALRHAIQPVRDNITALCQSFEQRSNEEKKSSDAIMSDLLEKTSPLLTLVDTLFTESNVVRIEAHDTVAQAAHNCIINFGNATASWRSVFDWENRLIALAASATTKEGLVASQKETVTIIICQEYEPVLVEIVAARDRAIRRSEAHPGQGKKAMLVFLREIKPLVSQINQLQQDMQAIRQLLYDRIIQIALTILTMYGNATKRWDEVLAVLPRIESLLYANAALQRLREAAQTHIARAYCAFCKRRKSDEGSFVKLTVYKVIQQDQSGIRYQTGTVTIPRCLPCKRNHERFSAHAPTSPLAHATLRQLPVLQELRGQGWQLLDKPGL